MRSLALVGVVFAVGCGHVRGSGGGDGGTPIAHLELTPADAMVTVAIGTPQAQPYTATLVAPDGTRTDVTSQVTFAVADGGIGTFAGATLTLGGAAAGPTQVTAIDAADSATGQTGLTVFVQGSRNDGTVPPNASQLFGAATEMPTLAPTLVYPADGVLMPPNLGAFDAHWNDTAGNNLFEVTLKGPYVDLRIYKAGTGAIYTTYTPDEWSLVAGAHQELTLSVAGLDMNNPAQKGTSAAQHVEVTNETMQGGIYYWTTTPPQGVFRYDMSTPSVAPSSFFPAGQEPGGAGNCMGCHALSHDGTKLALTIDSGDGRGSVFNVADRSVLVPFDTNAQYWNFATFTPDATKLVTVYHGQMVLRQTMGGALIGSPLTNTAGTFATHPELSPDGTMLANVETTSETFDFDVNGGTIVVRSFDDATNMFGPEKILVPNATAAANFYPSWSPDGQWILFTRTSGRSYNSATAEVWVVKADGSMPPIQLMTADTMTGSITNSWARWTPFAQTYGANGQSLFYITFSSLRQFGVRPLTQGTYGADTQIWMAPFFPDKALAGQDPSGPAFRMPFQDFATSNHIAQWTSAVVIGRKADGSPLTQAEAYGAKR